MKLPKVLELEQEIAKLSIEMSINILKILTNQKSILV